MVPVPDDLRIGLSEALEIIREAKRDPHIYIDYGDAIQVTNLCGGRVGTKKRPFEFSYYPGDGKSGERWSLAFHQMEIEDIVEGVLTELVLYCCDSPDCGHKSNSLDDHCRCDYITDPHLGNFSFPAAEEALRHRDIQGITPYSTSEDVIALLGEPTITGGGYKHEVNGYTNPWIKYHRSDCQLRFEFKRGKRLCLVSVMEADWKPGSDIPKAKRRRE